MEQKSAARAGRPRDAAVDQAILGAARELIAEQGYSSFSMEAVAARAGVGKQSIYRRWSSKGALLIDLYMDGLEGINPPPGKGFAKDFTAVMTQTVQRLKDTAFASILKGLMMEAQGDPNLKALFIEKIISPRRNMLGRVLRDAQASGELPKNLDVEMVLDFAFGAIWFNLVAKSADIDLTLPKRMLSVIGMMSNKE